MSVTSANVQAVFTTRRALSALVDGPLDVDKLPDPDTAMPRLRLGDVGPVRRWQLLTWYLHIARTGTVRQPEGPRTLAQIDPERYMTIVAQLEAALAEG